MGLRRRGFTQPRSLLHGLRPLLRPLLVKMPPEPLELRLRFSMPMLVVVELVVLGMWMLRVLLLLELLWVLRVPRLQMQLGL